MQGGAPEGWSTPPLQIAIAIGIAIGIEIDSGRAPPGSAAPQCGNSNGRVPRADRYPPRHYPA